MMTTAIDSLSYVLRMSHFTHFVQISKAIELITIVVWVRFQSEDWVIFISENKTGHQELIKISRSVSRSALFLIAATGVEEIRKGVGFRASFPSSSKTVRES